MSDYFKITTDSNSFLVTDSVTGLKGGTSVGLGPAAAFDSRTTGIILPRGHIIGTALFYPSGLGPYPFSKFSLDARKYYSPWPGKIFAGQVTTSYANGVVPFYELPQMGGDSQMRGYYEGGLRDNVLVDAQVEFRLHIWNIFGVVGWFGIGQVQNSYSQAAVNQFHLSYGPGLRIKWIQNIILIFVRFWFWSWWHRGFYVNFWEAF
jgi:outer membrane protein assembly factor BamA